MASKVDTSQCVGSSAHDRLSDPVAVKNLVITVVDTLGATGNATAFGPFALRPNPAGSAASSTSNGLTNPGVQIIGWICTPQPKLPPDTDPALIPPTESQNVTSILTAPVNAVERPSAAGEPASPAPSTS